VEEERPQRNSTTPCRSCGSDERARSARELRAAADTFQVIVACASCGAAFAALSRN
jgi:DNA-directed RNA polymerase subunit M/transcription elongation factor TFIIS